MSNSSLPSSEQVRLLAYKLLRSCCLNSFGLYIKYVALNYCVSTWNSVVLNEVSYICLKEMPSKDQCLFPVFSPFLCDPPFLLLQNATLLHNSPMYQHHAMLLYCVFYCTQHFSSPRHPTLLSTPSYPAIPYVTLPHPTPPCSALSHLTSYSLLYHISCYKTHLNCSLPYSALYSFFLLH